MYIARTHHPNLSEHRYTREGIKERTITSFYYRQINLITSFNLNLILFHLLLFFAFLIFLSLLSLMARQLIFYDSRSCLSHLRFN